MIGNSAMTIMRSCLCVAVAVLAMGQNGGVTGCVPEEVPIEVAAITTLQETGGRVGWLPDGSRIAFDMKGADGLNDIYTMAPDGSDVVCLTCDSEVLPERNIGQPSWHPSGDYLVLQAEDPTLINYPWLPQDLQDYLETAGIGVNNNVWILRADGSESWQVTAIADRLATLHPHFSPDGTRLVWAEAIMQRPGRGLLWTIKWVDVDVSSGAPVLGEVTTLQPGNFDLYETHGFSPDGERIVFSAAPGSRDYFGFEICTCELDGGSLVQLTHDREWDEHAHFSPDGQFIVWMTSRGIPQEPTLEDVKTDFWVMQSDGSGARRLTHFNTPGADEYMPGGAVAGDVDWSPDGQSLAACIIEKTERPYAHPTFNARIDLQLDTDG